MPAANRRWRMFPARVRTPQLTPMKLILPGSHPASRVSVSVWFGRCNGWRAAIAPLNIIISAANETVHFTPRLWSRNTRPFYLFSETIVGPGLEVGPDSVATCRMSCCAPGAGQEYRPIRLALALICSTRRERQAAPEAPADPTHQSILLPPVAMHLQLTTRGSWHCISRMRVRTISPCACLSAHSSTQAFVPKPSLVKNASAVGATHAAYQAASTGTERSIIRARPPL
jgi:hypothetical protein